MFDQNQNVLPISAAVAAAASANAAAGAARTSQEVIAARQETQISTIFALSPFLRANDLKVSVRDGKATLTGHAAESLTRELALRVALGVEGINAVDNNIQVDANYTPAAQSAERGFGEIIEDAIISATVKAKIQWSRHAEGLTANVTSTRGSVVLSGSAAGLEAKHFAGNLATNTYGVRSVNNQLMIVPAKLAIVRTEASDIADAWITTKVKSTFMLSSNVKGSNIAVTTEAGIVKLTGRMDSSADHALVINLVSDVRGVQGVDSSSLTM